jgi:hypothetical protein
VFLRGVSGSERRKLARQTSLAATVGEHGWPIDQAQYYWLLLAERRLTRRLRRKRRVGPSWGARVARVKQRLQRRRRGCIIDDGQEAKVEILVQDLWRGLSPSTEPSRKRNLLGRLGWFQMGGYYQLPECQEINPQGGTYANTKSKRCSITNNSRFAHHWNGSICRGDRRGGR